MTKTVLLFIAAWIAATAFANEPTIPPAPPNPPPNPSSGGNLSPEEFAKELAKTDDWYDPKHKTRARTTVERIRQDMCAKPQPMAKAKLEAQSPCADCDANKMIQSLGLGGLAKQASELGSLVGGPSARDLAFLDFFDKNPGLSMGYALHHDRTGTSAALAFERKVLAEQNTSIAAYTAALEASKEAYETVTAVTREGSTAETRKLFADNLRKLIAGHERRIVQAEAQIRYESQAIAIMHHDPDDLPSIKDSFIPSKMLKPDPIVHESTENVLVKAIIGAQSVNYSDFEHEVERLKKQILSTKQSIDLRRSLLASYNRLKTWASSGDGKYSDADLGAVFAANSESSSYEGSLDEIKGHQKLTKARIAFLEKRQAELAEYKRKHGSLSRAMQIEEKYVSHVAGKVVCGQSLAETFAVLVYANSGYAELNKALREGAMARERVMPFTDAVNAGLEKLKPVSTFVTRGAILPDGRLDQHRVGEVVEYPGFTSTSLGSGFGHPHRFTILVENGRYIGDISNYANEYEILLKSGTKFKILDRETIGDNIHITMTEVP